MTRERIGQLIFLGGVALSVLVYGLSVPKGLPWVPAARAGWWGYLVDAAYGHPCAAGVTLAAVAAGLLGALMNRYFGWRVATGAVLVWICMPPIWYGASVGSRSIAFVSLIVIGTIMGLWLVDATVLRVLRKAQTAAQAGLSGHCIEIAGSRGGCQRWVSWGLLGMAGLFAVVSLFAHDYRYGEAASVFAKGVAQEAAGRIVVVNGICEAQVVGEVKKRVEVGVGAGGGELLRYVSFREAARDRNAFVDAVRATFPGETNLWVAARVGTKAFLDVATKHHPERFYLMTGASTTIEGWERRWTDFEPYLKSKDPFVPVARRLFAYEGNAVANAMPLEVKTEGEGQGRRRSAAFDLYQRIYEEVDPGNFSALVNMSEMIRRGCGASQNERKRVHDEMDKFFRDARKRNHMREIAQRSGPIRVDEKRLEQLREESIKRFAEQVANGEIKEIPEGVKTLFEWNNDMIAAMEAKDIAKAGRIARAILTVKAWRGFIPANSILATVAAQEGDYVAAERFFAIATATTNQVPLVVLNDYADTLLHLGKLDEAEKWARRAVAASVPRQPMAKLTLAEVLEEKLKGGGVCQSEGRGRDDVREEIVSLLKDVIKFAPSEMKPRIRELQRKAALR